MSNNTDQMDISQLKRLLDDKVDKITAKLRARFPELQNKTRWGKKFEARQCSWTLRPVYGQIFRGDCVIRVSKHLFYIACKYIHTHTHTCIYGVAEIFWFEKCYKSSLDLFFLHRGAKKAAEQKKRIKEHT